LYNAQWYWHFIKNWSWKTFYKKWASLTPLAVSTNSQNTLPHAADKQINSVYRKLNKSYWCYYRNSTFQNIKKKKCTRFIFYGKLNLTNIMRLKLSFCDLVPNTYKGNWLQCFYLICLKFVLCYVYLNFTLLVYLAATSL